MSSPPPSKQYLMGKVLVNITMLQNWIPVLNSIIPLTITNPVNLLTSQLQAGLDGINVILNATPNPTIDPLKTIIPIILVIQIRDALDTFEYQYGGFNSPSYTDMTNNIHSIDDQYNIAYYNSSNLMPYFVY